MSPDNDRIECDDRHPPGAYERQVTTHAGAMGPTPGVSLRFLLHGLYGNGQECHACTSHAATPSVRSQGHTAAQVGRTRDRHDPPAGWLQHLV